MSSLHVCFQRAQAPQRSAADGAGKSETAVQIGDVPVQREIVSEKFPTVGAWVGTSRVTREVTLQGEFPVSAVGAHGALEWLGGVKSWW